MFFATRRFGRPLPLMATQACSNNRRDNMTAAFAFERRTADRRRAEIGDVVFDLIDAPAVLRIMCAWKNGGRREYISLVNPHSLMMCRRDERMKRAVRRAAVN